MRPETPPESGFPVGAAFAKGLTVRMGQSHVHNYFEPLLERIERGDIDPSRIITHHMKLDEAPGAYRLFESREKKGIKIVLTP